MTPANSRPLAEHDLSMCHRCGADAVGWVDVLGRAVGVCAEHRGPVELRSVDGLAGKDTSPMITPAHLPELWRLLVEFADATREDYDATQALADTYLAGTCDMAVEARCDSASIRKTKAERALAAFTRRVAAEPQPAPVGMAEIDDALLTVEMASENVALDNGRATIRRRDEAHDELLMLVRAALAARDERIAALERTESILRSVANVRTDGTIEQIAALVDVDLARRAAEWERIADEVAAANVEATARIAALEAGLRDAADDLVDHERWWRTVDEIAKADDALASIRAARAIADAGKVGA